MAKQANYNSQRMLSVLNVKGVYFLFMVKEVSTAHLVTMMAAMLMDNLKANSGDLPRKIFLKFFTCGEMITLLEKRFPSLKENISLIFI